ncbi:hypothetical protein CASFOL_033912 [Castilleja foliolosa]|uniref:Uncharacterized protein n=1 Tax=Castilleja foliolosa TaxID=1961234 RepID=A0ABD3BZF4_9LAMI
MALNFWVLSVLVSTLVVTSNAQSPRACIPLPPNLPQLFPIPLPIFCPSPPTSPLSFLPPLTGLLPPLPSLLPPLPGQLPTLPNLLPPLPSQLPTLPIQLPTLPGQLPCIRLPPFLAPLLPLISQNPIFCQVSSPPPSP